MTIASEFSHPRPRGWAEFLDIARLRPPATRPAQRTRSVDADRTHLEAKRSEAERQDLTRQDLARQDLTRQDLKRPDVVFPDIAPEISRPEVKPAEAAAAPRVAAFSAPRLAPLARWMIALLSALMFARLLGLIAEAWSIEILWSLGRDVYMTSAHAAMARETLETLRLVSSALFWPLFGVAAIMFLRVLRRAGERAAEENPSALGFSPRMAAALSLLPPACLIAPFAALKSAWAASLGAGAPTETPRVFVRWWAAWMTALALIAVVLIAAPAAYAAEGVVGPIVVNALSLLSGVALLISAGALRTILADMASIDDQIEAERAAARVRRYASF